MKRIALFSLLVFSLPVLAAKKVLDIQTWQTKGGTKVYFVQAKQLPILDIQIAFAAGSARDEQRFGVAALTSEMLAQGAGRYSTDQIAERFDTLGAQYGNDIARDMATVTLRSLTDEKHLKPALDLFATVISRPTFSSKAFARVKNQQLAAIQQKQQQAGSIANQTLYKAMYPKHPYGHPVLGTMHSVKAMKTKQLKAFYKQYYVSQNAVMAIVGDISQAKAKAIADKLTQGLAKGKKAQPIVAAPGLDKPVLKNIAFPSTQTRIRLGQAAIKRASDDYYALLVGNYIVGGGALVSRLADEVREKRGLSYSVYSTFIPMKEKGPFIVSLGTRQQKAAKALSVTQNTLAQFRAKGPSAKELDAGKSYITGSFPLRLDSNQAIVGNLLYMAFYDLPMDYLDSYRDNINAVSQAQVKDVFSKIVQPNKMVVVQVGKAS